MRISAPGLIMLAAEAQPRLDPGMPRADAIAQFVAAVGRHGARVASAIRVDLNQNEFDALVMLSFGLGTEALECSPVVQRLNDGARRQAADAFMRCAAGDERSLSRRRRERALFLAAVEAKDPLAGYTATERRLICEYDRLARSATQEERRLALRALLTQQRKRIWCAAQDSGWNHANRVERYRSLLARSA